MRRGLRGAGFAIALACTLALAPVQGGSRVTALLDLYLAGSHDEALAPLRAAGDVDTVVEELARDSGAWALKAETPEEIQRRRLAAASLALEFAVLRMADEWQTLSPLIEWGCAQVRQAGASDAELAWHRAALAAIQGARDNVLARESALAIEQPKRGSKAGPVPLCALRFPSDPVVQFARGFHQEFYVPVEGTMSMVSPGAATRAYVRAVDFYRRASEDPELADESTLAIGYIHLRMKRHGLALDELVAPAASPDPFVRYLAHLLRGRALEQTGKAGEAADAYRAALDVIPHAQSASIALAASRHVQDRADEAIAIMTASFAARPAEDPWREYGFGQFRHWPRYRDRMREALR